jgi:predicted nucleic acid-binding protein
VSVVSNSSPLIALSAINSLPLLHALYGTIYIPEAVFQEVVVRGAGRPGGTAVANAPWLVRHPVTNQQPVAQLRSAGLDQGESEAIALALELSANLLIVDERDARAIARQHGLAITGAVGVLIAAKNAGMAAAIKPLLGQLSAAGFYISPQTIAHALLFAGE